MATKRPATLDELRERALSGEHVDADEWARARTLAELAELQAEAERLAAERRAEAERLDQIRQIRADVLAAEAQVDDAEDMAIIAAAAARIIARHKRLAEAVKKARVRLARLGVAEGQEVEGITWRNAWMGRADSVVVDGRALGITPYPGKPLAQALLRACEESRTSKHVCAPHVQITVNRERTPDEIAEAEQRAASARRAALARIVERQRQAEGQETQDA